MAVKHSAACQACREIWSKINATSSIPDLCFLLFKEQKNVSHWQQ